MYLLVQALNKAAEDYYSKGESSISDREYDLMYDQLVELEQQTGIILPDSPTNRVGYQAVSKLKKIEHAYPALSLDKTKRREIIKEWISDQKAVVSLKIDGLTLVVTYRDGKLQ